MKRVIAKLSLSWLGSVLIFLIIAGTICQTKILSNYGLSFFEVFTPTLKFALVAYFLLIVVLLFPIDLIVSKSKLKKNKNFKILVLLSVTVIASAAFLLSIEPYIARDAIPYGVRQETNIHLNQIGYGLFNAMVYVINLVCGLLYIGVSNLFKSDKEPQFAS